MSRTTSTGSAPTSAPTPSRLQAAARAARDTPVVGPLLKKAARRYRYLSFSGSTDYWETRYASGGSSGDGSVGRLAAFKAEVVNDLCAEWGVTSVIEWGCGDGQQLGLFRVPSYIGLDVSRNAIGRCIRRHGGGPNRTFLHYSPDTLDDGLRLLRADLALSLDVIYHLVEDPVFEDYMRRLFASADEYVVIYSTDSAGIRKGAAHVRDRNFSDWIRRNAPEWRLERTIDNRYPVRTGEPEGPSSFATFACYARGPQSPSSAVDV